MKGRFLAAALVLLGVMAFIPSAGAKETFPSRPIELLVGYGPGGAGDIQARALADLVGKQLGQRVIVVNKDGMGGGIMISYLSRQKPDGYTIGTVFTATLASNPFLDKVDYSYKDLTYIMGYCRILHGISVRPDSPWKTFDELVEYARNNPGKVRYATFSSMSTTSFMMRLVAAEKKINWVHVPYKSDAPAAAAVMGGHVEAVATGSGQIPFVQSGKLRLLAVFNRDRFSQFPNIPTLQELGYRVPPLSDMTTYSGIVAPKGLAGEPFEKLAAAFTKAAHDPSFQGLMKQLSATIDILDAKGYEKQVSDSYEKIEKIYPALLKEIKK